MLTNQMPALTRALSAALPPAVVSQVVAALGQCAAPVTHRGGVNVQPTVRGGQNGLFGGGWDPNRYPGLLPESPPPNQIDITNDYSSSHNPSYYSSIYGGNSFFFPTSNEFTVNEYYGGPSNYFGGDSVFTNTITSNLTANTTVTNNLTTEVVNGEPVFGPAGPQGAPGEQGEDGRDGQDGRQGAPGAIINNIIWLPIFGGGRGPQGIPGPQGRPGRDAAKPKQKPAVGLWGDGKKKPYIRLPLYELNPDTCKLEEVGDRELQVIGLTPRKAAAPG